MAATQKKTATTTRTAAAKKPAARATAAKKPATKATAAKKPAAKASAAKTTTARKPAARTTAAKTTAARKPAAKTTTARKPAAKKSPFTPAFLQKQKQALLDERARYLEQAEALQQEADQLAADREPGDVQFDEESGEGDTIAVERERDLTLSAQARDAVRQIDEALDRMDKGVYGICIHSGEPIPKARLEAIPWAAERVEFKVAKLGS
jgi:RNA polymerase-binding transcription factor DksA